MEGDGAMNYVKEYNAMQDAGVRIDALLYIPAISGEEGAALPDLFGDDGLVFNFPETKDEELIKALPFLEPLVAQKSIDAEDVWELLHENQTPGFLFQAAAPVAEYEDGEIVCGSASYSHHYFTWLYAEDQSKIVPTAIAWAKRMQSKGKLKSLGQDA